MWYRLVGVDLSSQSNLIADAQSSVRFVAGQLNMELSFGSFVQVVAPNTSVTSGAIRLGDVCRCRKCLSVQQCRQQQCRRRLLR